MVPDDSEMDCGMYARYSTFLEGEEKALVDLFEGVKVGNNWA
jgi:hypothetical protein